MKLIDILARDLKEWPRDLAPAISQAVDGSLIFDLCFPPSNEECDYEHSSIYFELASDWVIACVTRAEWEAAQ